MIAPLLLVALQGSVPHDSITLAEALTRARQSRARAGIAAAQVDEAVGAFRGGSALPNPILSYSHSVAVPTNHLIVDQPLDWLLTRASDRAALRSGIARARADSTATMLALDTEVRRSYWRARAALLSHELIVAQAALADSVARLAAARLRAGDISLFEQEQAATEAARARQAVSVARELTRTAASDFARALGVDSAPVPADPLDAGLGQPPPAGIDPALVPALQASVADSETAAALARRAARARLPFPTLQGGVEWGDPTQRGSLALLGIAIPIPLWQRGGGTLAEARARAVRAAGLAREARLDAQRDLSQARVHLEETAARARTARDELIPAASRLSARALRAYQAGETGILQVLEALRSGRDVVLSALQDELAYQDAVTEWYALTGRSE